MKDNTTRLDLAEEVGQFVRSSFSPKFGRLQEKFVSKPVWQRLRQLGSELWLDTGDIDVASELWTREFTALTTNNTLLNKEVQKGTYDALIHQAADQKVMDDRVTDLLAK